ncbi:MAG: nucleoside hydrolase [Bryobacteraceae bacterium]
MVNGTVGAGLVTPVAAPDIHRDAEAAKIVFESGLPILMVELTAGAQAHFTRKDAARLLESIDPVARFVGALWGPYLDFADKMGPSGAAINDALGGWDRNRSTGGQDSEAHSC